MKKKLFLIVISLLLLINTNIYHNNKTKSITIESKKYLTSASDAGFESEELYRCVLDTLGEDRTSATDSELSQITEVICRDQNITSTKGIEKLTALRYLNLYNNKVTSMDLSKNTNLVMLNMTFNSLTSIDLSKNPNLQQLYLNGNKINSIDLSNNSELIDLNLYNNELSTINVSNLTNLKFLLLSLNNLMSIDLSKNTNLEHVYLSGNNISSLSLPTSAEALTRLDLNANKLTSIDLSSLSNLNYLIVSANSLSNLDITKNTNLEYLYSSSNKISSINLSNNAGLIDLDLYNNKLSSIDISKLTNLKYINVSLNNLSELNLNGLTNLNKVYASSNNLSNLSLTSQSNLNEINAVFNNFDEYDINDKSKITYMVVEDEWLNNMDLSSYTGLKNLDVDHYEIIPVYGNSITISEIVNNTPSNITLNEYTLYNGFNSINSNSTSICKYDVEYTVDGSTSSKETTTINTCTDDTYESNTITGENGKYVRMQVYSEDMQINNFTSDANLKYDGYYEVRFMNLTSDKYTIDEKNNIIDVETDSDQDILNNVKLPWSDMEISINNDKLQIHYNNQLLKEFTLNRITNPSTGSSYIYLTFIIIGITLSIIMFYGHKLKKTQEI